MEVLDSFWNNKEDVFFEYFEDYRFSKLEVRNDYKDLLDKKEDLLVKFPKLRDIFENEKLKSFSKEENKALLEVITLESELRHIEIKEAFKLGAKEFIVFAIEQELIKTS